MCSRGTWQTVYSRHAIASHRRHTLDNGHYTYQYIRGVSTLYLATPRQ
jgi:hypothetical protein